MAKEIVRRGNKRDRALIQLGLAHATALGVTIPTFVFRPNEPAPSGNVFTDWNKLYALARTVPGKRWIEIDGRLNGNTATIPNGAYNFGPTADVTIAGTGFFDPSTIIRTTLNVGNVTFPDGNGQSCIERISSLFVNYTSNVGPCIELSGALNRGVEFVLDAANVQSGAEPFFSSANGGGILYLERESSLLTGTGPSFRSIGTSFAILTCNTGAQIAHDSLDTDLTGLIDLTILASAGNVSTSQATIPVGNLAVVYGSPTENITLQKGVTTLVTGVSPAISARITASSRIVVTRKAVNGSTALGFLAALAADRVVGSPGSFKVTSQQAGGAVEAADASTVDWYVLG